MATQNQYSVNLAGDDAYSAVAHTDLAPTTNFTVGGWIKSSSGTTQIVIANYYYDDPLTTRYGFYFGVDATGVIRFNIANGTGTVENTNFVNALGTTDCTDGTWHWIVGTYDGSNVRLYLDGALETTTGWAGGAAYYSTKYPRVGCLYSATGNSAFVTGNLDGVFLVNGTVWTQPQALSYKYQDVTGATNLKAYYKFENNGSDSSGNSHTLTDISVPTYQSGAGNVPFNYYRDSNFPTGGTITADGDFYIHTFKLADSGTSMTFSNAGNVALLVCGSGGGGGGSTQVGYGGGGGGAGEYSYTASQAVEATSYTVTVADGGAGGGGGADGTAGGSSSFGALDTAIGGGYGAGGKNSANSRAGGNGACGGGAGGCMGGSAGSGGTGTVHYNGGGASTGGNSGGGGGSSGEGGYNGSGTQGAGTANSISGTSVTYCQGGDGTANDTEKSTVTDNKGWGGNGSSGQPVSHVGYDGGSGVVIVRYLATDFDGTSSVGNLLTMFR